MKVNLSTLVTDPRGVPVKDGNEDLTVGNVCASALLTPDGKDQEANEKVKRFKLAMRVVEGGEQDLSMEEIVLLKTLIGKHYAPLIVGRTYEVLEP